MTDINELMQGLRALADTSFPKKCANCGREYQSVEEYILETEGLEKGIKAVEDEGEHFLEMYRNCVCGSTLMDFFQDRRDLSERGLKRRAAFGKVLDALVERGFERDLVRQELLKLLRRQPTDFFKKNNIDLSVHSKSS
jgi:hypothetical protein